MRDLFWDILNSFLVSIVGSVLAIFLYNHFFKPKVYVVDIYRLSAEDGYPVSVVYSAAERKGYKGLILDKNMVIYAPEGVDITDELEDYLRRNYQGGTK
ncbi:MAG TPA: hypothetical protein ENO30_05875 [Thermodesulfobium narugense]|nr:hypothetical protein [Thermodesulfobium narugense]